jgi:hypothetical protein
MSTLGSNWKLAGTFMMKIFRGWVEGEESLEKQRLAYLTGI